MKIKCECCSKDATVKMPNGYWLCKDCREILEDCLAKIEQTQEYKDLTNKK